MTSFGFIFRIKSQVYHTFKRITLFKSVFPKWRILRFAIHDRDPAIMHLDVHLENGERVYFTETTVQRALEEGKETTLTAFF